MAGLAAAGQGRRRAVSSSFHRADELAEGRKVSEARFPIGGVESGGVHVVVDASLRTVTLARPAKRNALNAAMLNGLREAFGSQPSDEERVAVIRAEGPVFCAGSTSPSELEAARSRSNRCCTPSGPTRCRWSRP